MKSNQFKCYGCERLLTLERRAESDGFCHHCGSELDIHDLARDFLSSLTKAEESLRSLASFVGAGGYNADKVDADMFEQKIRWGIGQIMERLEKAEAELARMREQEPLTWGTSGELMDILKNPIYSSPAPVPAVAAPDGWRKVMAELADDLAIEIDQNYPPERRAYPSEQRKYEGEMVIVNRARALLQSPTIPVASPIRGGVSHD